MQISIQANGFSLTEGLRAHVERRMRAALGWSGGHLRRLAVSLSDINGPRGGRDKRCKVQVRLAGGAEVVIEDTETDLYAAIDRAAERADRAVVRRMERQRGFEHVRPAVVLGSADADADDDHSPANGPGG